MNLTTEELIKLVEEYDLKARTFEDKIKDNTTIEYRELEDYNATNITILLCLVKLKQITIDEMLEACLDQLHK
jgi:hypothetical protein